MVNIVIVDDHKVILNGFISMLKPLKDIHVQNTFHNSTDLLDYLVKEQPDILFLDINLPDIDGLSVCKQISKEYPNLRIIAFTSYTQSNFVKNMMRNGAKGYLPKDCTQEDIKSAIETVMSGELYLPKNIREQLLDESFGMKSNNTFIPELTRREKEVLGAIAEELTNKEIAEKLFISIKTVETHRNNLLQKFDVKNTAGLIKKAYQFGLIS